MDKIDTCITVSSSLCAKLTLVSYKNKQIRGTDALSRFLVDAL